MIVYTFQRCFCHFMVKHQLACGDDYAYMPNVNNDSPNIIFTGCIRSWVYTCLMVLIHLKIWLCEFVQCTHQGAFRECDIRKIHSYSWCLIKFDVLDCIRPNWSYSGILNLPNLCKLLRISQQYWIVKFVQLWSYWFKLV